MTRSAPSPADQRVAEELAARGLVVTASQLESWRRIGLLPRHRRRGLGRGRGSVVDAVDPVVIESAAALARHFRQGRDRRLGVLAWFAEAGAPQQPGAAEETVVPEPPIAAVREALEWAVSTSPSQRLLDVAHRAAEGGDEGLDGLYEAVGRILAAQPHPGPAPHPDVLRAALLTGGDLPEGPGGEGLVHLVASIAAGPTEIGGDALAEAFAAIGMFGLSAENWARMLGAAERGEAPPPQWRLLDTDRLGRLQRASDSELLRARTVLLGLQMFYGLYAMHGLLMPDTPGLAALRERIDASGMGPLLDHMISLHPSPRQFADGVLACLESYLDALYETLMEQLAADPAIFHLPGDPSGAAGFIEMWMRSMREQMETGADPAPGPYAPTHRCRGPASQRVP